MGDESPNVPLNLWGSPSPPDPLPPGEGRIERPWGYAGPGLTTGSKGFTVTIILGATCTGRKPGSGVMTDSPNNIAVRAANESDLPLIVSFNAAMARETEGRELDSEALRQGVAAMLRRPELGFYLIAEVDGKVAGQLMITTEWSDWRNGFFWWIQSVYVAPEFRRQGVYRELYRHVTAEAQSKGEVRGIRLYVAKENRPAQAVYQRLGMSDSGYDLYEVEF